MNATKKLETYALHKTLIDPNGQSKLELETHALHKT
jgi:hypothetical protein